MASVVDKPTLSSEGETLGTGIYAKTLTEFIKSSKTPLTIGIQGEWGSGKTSILNMIRESLTQGQASSSRGDSYHLIWINTWEHAVLKTPEATLISIINEIIDEVSRIGGKWETATKAKQALQGVVMGAAKIAASYAAGVAAADAVGEGFSSTNNIKSLRQTLRKILFETAGLPSTTLDENEAEISKQVEKSAKIKFVIFVDDLDRLEPATAVKVLELLKNIFDLELCIFVLAIDYQVVVKGLESKFGKPTQENEWEFRAFFDKIIQLPFMMPMGAYDLNTYLVRLLKDIEWAKGTSLNRIEKRGEASWLYNIVALCIGYNPRSLKRLSNSLAMISLLIRQWENAPELRKKELNNKEIDDQLKNLILSLICLQISFPKIYGLLLREPNFVSSWNEDFVRSQTRPNFTPEKDKEADSALSAAYEDVSDDWDEDWEKALFKVVWINGWQKSRLTESSRVLSLIKDDPQLLGQYLVRSEEDDEQSESEDEEFKARMQLALKVSSVTSIASADILSSGKNVDEMDDREIRKEAQNSFWKKFQAECMDKGSCFDPKVNKYKNGNNISAGHIGRKVLEHPHLELSVRVNQQRPLEIKVLNRTQKSKNWIAGTATISSDIQESLPSVDVDVSEDGKKVSISFPREINTKFKKGEVSMWIDNPQSEAIRSEAATWLSNSILKVEKLIHERMQKNWLDEKVESPSEAHEVIED